MKTFRVTFRHDKGQTTFTTYAMTKVAAKNVVQTAENCPDSAILSVEEVKCIEELKKGDLFRLLNSGRVYVRDTYNAFAKKYDAYRYDDVNHLLQLKRGTFVEIDFTF